MNYSTMPQEETDQPLLNREIKLSLKTVLGAAAFACGAQSNSLHASSVAARRRRRRFLY